MVSSAPLAELGPYCPGVAGFTLSNPEIETHSYYNNVCGSIAPESLKAWIV